MHRGRMTRRGGQTERSHCSFQEEQTQKFIYEYYASECSSPCCQVPFEHFAALLQEKDKGTGNTVHIHCPLPVSDQHTFSLVPRPWWRERGADSVMCSLCAKIVMSSFLAETQTYLQLLEGVVVGGRNGVHILPVCLLVSRPERETLPPRRTPLPSVRHHRRESGAKA